MFWNPALRRERTVVPALLFGGALRLVAHMSYPTGEESVECSDSIFSLVQLKEGV